MSCGSRWKNKGGPVCNCSQDRLDSFRPIGPLAFPGVYKRSGKAERRRRPLNIPFVDVSTPRSGVIATTGELEFDQDHLLPALS